MDCSRLHLKTTHFLWPFHRDESFFCIDLRTKAAYLFTCPSSSILSFTRIHLKINRLKNNFCLLWHPHVFLCKRMVSKILREVILAPPTPLSLWHFYMGIYCANLPNLTNICNSRDTDLSSS